MVNESTSQRVNESTSQRVNESTKHHYPQFTYLPSRSGRQSTGSQYPEQKIVPLGGQPRRADPTNFELLGPTPVQTMVKRSR